MGLVYRAGEGGCGGWRRGAEANELTGREGKAEKQIERKNYSYDSWVFIEAG